MNKTSNTTQEKACIKFGDFEDEGDFGIWLCYAQKHYLLFPNALVKMLIHKDGEMVVSRRDGEGWSGLTTKYRDGVDEYVWIICDCSAQSSTYVAISKTEMHYSVRLSFQQLYEALKKGYSTYYYRAVNAQIMKTYLEEMDIIMFASTKKYQTWIDNCCLSKLSFECKHAAYDLDFTLCLDGHKIVSKISEWSTSLRLLRYQLENDDTVNLYYEDSPTTISFLNKWYKQSLTDSVTLVEIVPDSFTDGAILVGLCDREQVLQTLYEGLLRMARFTFVSDSEAGITWGEMDNLTFYNKIKSPIVETIIRRGRMLNEVVECRQVLIRHVITISPASDYLYMDERGCRRPLFHDGKVVIEFDDDVNKFETDIPGYEAWYKSFVGATDFAIRETDPSFDFDKWEQQGIELAKQLRDKLPESCDLWYNPPFEDKKRRNEGAVLITKKYTTHFK